MVKLNGKGFISYTLDTADTIRVRVAKLMKTIPDYLFIQEDEKGDLTAKDLLEAIKEDGKESINFVKFFQSIDSISDKLDVQNDIFIPWLAFNKSFHRKDTRENLLFLLDSQLKDADFEFSVNFQDDIFWTRDVPAVMRRISKKIGDNAKLAKEQKKLLETYEKIETGVETTPFKLEKMQIELILDSGELSILEIFNSILLDRRVPFATISDFYKILKDFVPLHEWAVVSLDDVILLRVSEDISLEKTVAIDYHEAIVAKNPKGELSALITLDVGKGKLTRELFIERFIGVFKTDITVVDQHDSKVYGMFTMVDQTINKYVLSELVMNDLLLSSVLSINEGKKATKQKSDIYVYMTHARLGSATLNITGKIANPKDSKEFSIKENTPYLRIKIKTAAATDAQVFIGLFSKLMTYYNDNYERIVNEYREYIPDFADEKITEIQSEKPKTLRDMVPDLFTPSGYVRQCGVLPHVVSDEEASALKGKQVVMRFPIYGESPPKNYVCNDEIKKYPGLKTNTLGNSDKFPYLPCCYKVNQADKGAGSKYNHYFYGQELKKPMGKTQDVIVTNKFVKQGKYGILPPNILKLLNGMKTEVSGKFMRKGVSEGNMSSFIECVMEALSEGDEFSSLNYISREALVKSWRDSINTVEIAVSRQCGYDMTCQELDKIVKNSDEYMSPRLFIPLLEAQFNCVIYLFTRKNVDGEFTLPRHTQSYYRNYTENRPRILLYEHIGSESDNASAPRCELITYISGAGNTQKCFTAESLVGIEMEKLFELSRLSYTLNKRVVDTIFNIPSEITVKSQYIDTYGKCRYINIEYAGEKYSLITTPIPPLAITEMKRAVIHKQSMKSVMRLVKYSKMELISQTVAGRKVKELVCIFGNVKIAIPVKNSNPIAGLANSPHSLHFPTSTTSLITDYNFYKKLSRYITEYLFWLYSKYTGDSVSEFFNEKIIVIPDYAYGIVSKTFDQNSPILRDGKLVVTSDEMRKRLYFVLSLALTRKPLEIAEYRNKTYLSNFYVDVTDFTEYSSQVVLEGDFSVQKWISEYTSPYRLFNSINVGSMLPYFFSSPQIDDGGVCIVQNAGSLEEALSVSLNWFIKGYNKVSSTQAMREKPSYTLYELDNGRSHRVVGVDDGFPHKILTYKVADESHYSAVLSL